jgi:hypothetical protein
MDAQMTKTRASTLARQARRHGWYRRSATEGYVFCPCCREEVSREYHPWLKVGAIMRELDIAVIEHLRYECEKTDV